MRGHQGFGIVGLVIGLAACISPVGSARADGFIIVDRPILPPEPWPRPRPIPPRIAWFPLEVKNHIVTATIRENVGTTRIDQVFRNPNNIQMEGTYMFPLPETAAVARFSMWMNGKEVQGELLDADKARQTYEDIVRKMKDPALLEYMGGRLYKARVFPIPANGDVRIALEYTETITVDSGLAVYRYPLNTEKFSAKEIDLVTITVDINSQIPLRSVYCPTHNASVSRPSDRQAKVGFEARGVKPDRDFLVYYQMSEKEFGLTLLSYRPFGEDGFFMARLAPPLSVDASRIVPKDVCFVYDTSGSMAGDKIVQARRAMNFCLSSLRPEDRFNLIAFSTEARPFKDTLVPATRENIEAARELVQKSEAVGGTAINEALLAAINARPAGQDDRPYMIVFLTDGEPTIGERDPARIQANVKQANNGRSRLFVFGIGHDLNTKLLDRLAEDNRGTREYIDEKEDIEIKVSNFFRKVSEPVLSDISIRFGEAGATEIYPRQLPDLFHGNELVVVGRYTRPGPQTATLTGKRGSESMSWTFPATFAEGRTDADFIPRLWATSKIGFLMDDIRLRGETKELKDEIVRLAKKYAILTPYTSYLILEDTPVVAERPTGSPPAAAESLAWGLRSTGKSDIGMQQRLNAAGGYGGATGGKIGVQASSEAKSLKEGNAPGAVGNVGGDEADFAARLSRSKDGAPGKLQIVGSKTFYHDGERWIDSEFEGKAETRKVQAFSDDYFALLKAVPEIGRYLSLGSRVVVVVKAVAYEITE